MRILITGTRATTWSAPRVHPVATADFPRPARRPAYSPLSTLQDPSIVLPPWEEGVDDLVRALRGDA